MLVPPHPTNKAPDPICDSPDVDKAQPRCVFFCIKGSIPPAKFVWVKSDALANYGKIGPL